jgi:hypothetical protein
MTLKDLAVLRISNQHLAGTKFKTARELVGWMGAMQAQDYDMARWAIGCRLVHSTDKLIQKAIDKGEIIRTHLLRPTWHFVSSEDIYWMLELTAPRIRSSLQSITKSLELTDSIFKKSNAIIQRALTEDTAIPREELVARLQAAKINTDSYRSMHLLLHAELTGLICSGPSKGGRRTHALLEQRVQRPKAMSRDDALKKLALKYFSSHGPATAQDFMWWSGLSALDVRNALEMIQAHFISETIGKEVYWFKNSSFPMKDDKRSIYLLPAFDEFIISYRSRGVSLLAAHSPRAISSNGIFRPTIVLDGQVIGLWKKTRKKEVVLIETELFKPLNQKVYSQIEQAVELLSQFTEKQTLLVRK